MVEGKNLERYSSEADRCQGFIGNNQRCNYKVLGSSNFCALHGGNNAVQSDERRLLNNYRINKYFNRLKELTDSPQIKNLRDEIALLRVIVEEKFNACHDATDILISAGPLSELISKIEKIVVSCHKLETSLGSTMDKNQAIQLGQELGNIINKYIPGEIEQEKVMIDVARLIERMCLPTNV